MKNRKKVKRKSSLSNRFSKMYPFKEEVPWLETPPLVDAAVIRLARQVTLPMNDAMTVKDALDRRMDNDIRKVYTPAGSACRPVLAITSVVRAIKAWAEKAETDLRASAKISLVLKSLTDIKQAGDFVSEAAIDSRRCSGRVMLFSVMGRRALWLIPWMAEASSKSYWCHILFDRAVLFGNKLESAISKVTGGRAGMLPQDVRSRQ